ncbi:MAG TPA: ABC transporter ATP-binding protein [Candidatus Polarisedimenticolia bacterium]|nr:ABC transporter ATP-binding protein [Candidatus Polarisedimenticolia bacterium]
MSSSVAEPLLRCRGVARAFGPPERRVEVLRDLDLTVDRGEMVAILGESGAGKTTLLHLIGALDRPDTGAILFRGRDIGRLAAAERATYRNRDLGFVFQLHHLLPEFSALENAMMPLLIRGVEPGRARPRAVALLEELGLRAHMGRRPTQLSGGEQQRVAIARAIVGGPSLLLADEPTGNLDERNAAAVFELLLDLHRTRGMTTVLVTHSARLAARCSRVLTMEHGSLTASEGARYNNAAGTTRVPR